MTPTSASSAICSRCGQKVPLAARFCDFCGQRIEAPEPEPEPEIPPVAEAEEPEPASAPAPVAVTVPSVTPADAKHAQKLLERADDLLQRGDFHAASVACRQSLALVPSASGYFILAGILRGEGNREGAQHAISKAQQLAEPDSPLLPKIEVLANLLNRPLGTNPLLTPNVPLTASLDTPLPPVVPPTAEFAEATEAAETSEALEAPADTPTPHFVNSVESDVAPAARPEGVTSRSVMIYVAALLVAFFVVFALVSALQPTAPPTSPTVTAQPPASEVGGTAEETPQGVPGLQQPPVEGQPPQPDGEVASPPAGSAEAPRPAVPPVAPGSGPQNPGSRPAAPPRVEGQGTPPAGGGGRPIRPRPQPTTAVPASPPARFPASSGQPPAPPDTASSSGGTAMRVPSALPTPIEVESPQRPTVDTPR